MSRFLLGMVLITCLSVLPVAAVAEEGDLERAGIEVSVDPRVELLCIVFRLTGDPEFTPPSARSPYAGQVDAYFAPYRDHAAVKTARELRAQRNIGYDAVMSLAVHLRDAWDLEEKSPFGESRAWLHADWQLDEVRGLVEHVREFVADAKFREFWNDHADLYEEAARRLRERLDQDANITWIHDFFGAPPGSDFEIILSLLSGARGYTAGIRHEGGREEFCPIVGVWRFDPQGRPIISGDILRLVAEQYCRAHTNPIARRYEGELAAAGRRIYALREQRMKPLGITSWQDMIDESLAEACYIRYAGANLSAGADRSELPRLRDRGFLWMEELVDLVSQYQNERDKYPTFADFMPRIVEFYNTYVDEFEALIAKLPKVVKTEPPVGATNVDPATQELKVYFDRPMHRDSRDFEGRGPHFPYFTWRPMFDEEGRVLTIKVRLDPNWDYRFWLNRLERNRFKSQEDYPLESFRFAFTTGDWRTPEEAAAAETRPFVEEQPTTQPAIPYPTIQPTTQPAGPSPTTRPSALTPTTQPARP